MKKTLTNLEKKTLSADLKKYNHKADILRRFGRSEIVINLVELIEKRKENAEKMPFEFEIEKKLKSNLQKIAQYMPASGHSMGEMKIAECLKYSGDFDNCREYARRCKYKAVHGEVHARIPLNFATGNLQVDGCLIQKELKKISKNISVVEIADFKVDGLRFTETATFSTKKTYFAKVASYSKHCDTLLEARSFTKYAKTQIKDEMRVKKEKEKNEQAKRADFLRRIANQKFCFNSSLRAGNCKPGTISFCRMNGLKLSSILTGRALLKRFADNKYVLQMLEYRYKRLTA